MCYSNPCQNQGTCVSKEGGYTCVCHENYVGQDCEVSVLQDSCSSAPGVCSSPSSCAPLIKGGFLCENCTQSPFYNDFCQLEARSFSNGAFLSLSSLTQRFKFNLQLEFATIQKSGLLLYNGRYNGKHDFISLAIENEGVKFMFSTGGDTGSDTAEVMILYPVDNTISGYIGPSGHPRGSGRWRVAPRRGPVLQQVRPCVLAFDNA